MVLLSQMIRSQAITGSTDASWFQTIAGRQGGRWAEQHVGAAFPQRGSGKPADAADRDSVALRGRGDGGSQESARAADEAS